MILLAPDETTRAIIDMYARTAVDLIPGPIGPAALDRLASRIAAAPRSLVVVQVPGRANVFATQLADMDAELPWLTAAHLRVARSYSLRNGRRYALLESQP
jgi:hypothetical protein